MQSFATYVVKVDIDSLPAKVGGDDIAWLELRGTRFDDIADRAALKRFADFKRRYVTWSFVHAAAHVRVHRHEEVAYQHLVIL